MPRNSTVNPFKAKEIARRRYAERQIDKYVNWSWSVRGKVSYNRLVKMQDEFKIECYACRKE